MSGKKFHFSLDSILRLRKHKTERAHQELADAVHERSEQEQRVEQAHQRLIDVTQCTLEVASNPVTLRQRDAFRQDAKAAYEAACQRLTELRRQEQRARTRLLQVRRDEEALQTLYEEERADHRKAQAEAEAAFLDQHAVMSFSRKNHALNS